METLIKGLVSNQYNNVIRLRRYFHTYPELSGKEANTQKIVIEELSKIGIKAEKIAGTGVLAEIKGNGNGKIIAIRADMDALPIMDESNTIYQSKNYGICHACGHDAHIAILLGVAYVLTNIKNKTYGTVRLLFQPSEEGFPSGASTMVNEGAIDNVAAILGLHLWQPLNVGMMGYTYGPMMASPDAFSLTIKGQGGHGAMPHQTIDPILIGSQIICALNAIIGREIEPLDQAVVSIGAFNGGDTFNVIPDMVVIKGTIRSFRQTTRALLLDRLESIAQAYCQAWGAELILEKYLGCPPVTNDIQVTDVVLEAASKVFCEDQIVKMNPMMIGEDFAYYQNKIPGSFVLIGCGNLEKGIVYPHHHSKFDIDEKALIYGMEVLSIAAIKLLDKLRNS